MKHRILFLHEDLKTPKDGGIQRVTYSLASYFISKGHEVYFMAWRIDPDKYKLSLTDKKMDSQSNKDYIRRFVHEKNIDIVINQAGVSPDTSKLAFEAKKEGAKLISCIHNTLLGHIENIDSYYYPRLKKKHLSFLEKLLENRMVKQAALQLYIQRYRHHYTLLCEKSNRVVLLSEAFMSELSQFTGSDLAKRKACAIANPLSYDEVKCSSHDKRVLYVGRLENKQKRVDLLLKIWADVSPSHPEWSLDIVGRGPDEADLKKKSSELNLNNITFHGFVDPRPYYEKASILCLTSSYEGFGVVLLEAMQYGVVPMAFNSYRSVTDIIKDNINGILVSPFDVKEFSRRMSELMDRKDIIARMSKETIKNSESFSIGEIGRKWDRLFETIS